MSEETPAHLWQAFGSAAAFGSRHRRRLRVVFSIAGILGDVADYERSVIDALYDIVGRRHLRDDRLHDLAVAPVDLVGDGADRFDSIDGGLGRRLHLRDIVGKFLGRLGGLV